MPNRIVLATGNPGKIREIQSILKPYLIVPQSDFDVPNVEETGTTFVENAIIKARNAATHSGLPAIADDSGIEVDALNGAPGVYSARYSGPTADDQQNLDRLLQEMISVVDDHRNARFRCVIVYMRHAEDPCPIITEGTWEGKILRQSRGVNGFGYDPIFLLPELGCTSAELAPDQKNRLSHRAQALNTLAKQLEKSRL